MNNSQRVALCSGGISRGKEKEFRPAKMRTTIGPIKGKSLISRGRPGTSLRMAQLLSKTGVSETATSYFKISGFCSPVAELIFLFSLWRLDLARKDEESYTLS